MGLSLKNLLRRHDPAAALAVLEYAWGDIYTIEPPPRRWRAVRRGTRVSVTARTPARLNTAIRADWAGAGQ